MKLKNLYKEYRTAIIKSRFIGYDAKTGKFLFDSFRERDHVIAEYGEYEVKALWAEIIPEKGSDYFQIARPTIKIMLKGEENNEC